MATKQRITGVRTGSVTKEIDQIIDIYAKQKKRQLSGKKIRIPWVLLRKIVDRIKSKRTFKNEKTISDGLHMIVTLLDGSVRQSHDNMYDTCAKREKEASAKGDYGKASLYKSMTIFYISEFPQHEEFDVNHTAPIKGPKRVTKAEITPLINAAKVNNEIFDINEEFENQGELLSLEISLQGLN